MSRTGWRWMLFVATMLVAVGLPILGKWVRSDQPPRCTFDGLRIEPLYRVRVVSPAGESYSFGCVRCADRWLARHGADPAAVYVTDEASGVEIAAATAYFVESPVVTNRVTGNRVHAFRDRASAEAHIRIFGGALLVGDERPLGTGRNELRPK